MNIVITCGPAWEPVDRVRRLTNFSTGRLGITLANRFTGLGWSVFCLKGEQSTCADSLRAHSHIPFSTNDDLASKLQELGRDIRVDAVLHAAALCDYKVAGVRAEDGRVLDLPKIPTCEGRIQLQLVPATKLLPQLREMFPTARIVGWKYELNGGREAALEAAQRQLREAHADACVLNGAAYGPGFALVTTVAPVVEVADAAALSDCLDSWLRSSIPEQPAQAQRPEQA